MKWHRENWRRRVCSARCRAGAGCAALTQKLANPYSSRSHFGLTGRSTAPCTSLCGAFVVLGWGFCSGVVAGDGAGGAHRRESWRVLRRLRVVCRAVGIRPRLSESSRAWLTDRLPLLTRFRRSLPLPAGVVRATAGDCWPLFTMWGTRRAGSGGSQGTRSCIGSCNPSGLRRKNS